MLILAAFITFVVRRIKKKNREARESAGEMTGAPYVPR